MYFVGYLNDVYSILFHSKCSTGEGIFSFTTQEADRIHTAVHRASNAIVTAYKASKDTSNTVVSLFSWFFFPNLVYVEQMVLISADK